MPAAELKVHPIADLFPMMPDDELAELAADIRYNGLIHPIVLVKWTNPETDEVEWVIGDGRNRYKACKIARVKPDFVELDGNEEEIKAYIVSANLKRRNLNKGQQMAVLAMIYPDGGQGGPGSLDQARQMVAETATISDRLLRRARQVLRICRAMPEDSPFYRYPEQILAGELGLDAALDELKEATGRESQQMQRLRLLREARPDLAEQVDLDLMTLAEAEEKQREDVIIARGVRQSVFTALRDFLRSLEGILHSPEYDDLADWLQNDDYLEEFRRYFRGGVAEFLERSKEEDVAEAVKLFLALRASLETEE